MKILCLELDPSSRRGGQEWSMLDECRGLVTLGHDVTLGYAVAGDLLPQYEAGGVRTVDVGELWLSGGMRAGKPVRFARGVARAIGVRSDVVVINEYHESLFGALVARARNVPLVCHLRLMSPWEFCGQWRIGVSQVTRFIAVSHATKENWVARGIDPERVDVVHDGIDIERFRPYDTRNAVRDALGIPRDAFMVAFGGRLDRGKNLEALLETFAGLGMGRDAARLVIMGRPVVHATPEEGERYVAGLKGLAERLGIAEQVHWLGSRGDLPEIVSAADAAALFAREPEPLARGAYEALACGTPIIVQRTGGMHEVLSGEFSRYIFDGTDRAGAIALLRSLVGWQRTDPTLGERVRAHAMAHFSRESMVAGIAASLERALTTRPRHRGPSRARLRVRGLPAESPTFAAS